MNRFAEAYILPLYQLSYPSISNMVEGARNRTGDLEVFKVETPTAHRLPKLFEA